MDLLSNFLLMKNLRNTQKIKIIIFLIMHFLNYYKNFLKILTKKSFLLNFIVNFFFTKIKFFKQSILVI